MFLVDELDESLDEDGIPVLDYRPDSPLREVPPGPPGDNVQELLRLGIRSGNVDVARRFIVDHGADPNECGPNDNPAGETALTLAIKTKSREMV